jgi:hypothetical protein
MAKTVISTKKKQNLQSNHDDDDYFCARNVVEEAIRFCGAPQHQCMISGFVILPIELCERRIDAEAASCEVALAIVKLAFEGPIILKDFSAYLR